MGRGLDGYLISVHWHCVVLKAREERPLPVSGGYCEGETPLPIPNRAVKPLSADGTWPARAWESRTPPVFLSNSSQSRDNALHVARRGRAANVKKAREFFRANPQAFLLLVICVVLGIGSFIAIVISLATSGGQNTGEPEGLIRAVHAIAFAARLGLTPA